MRAHLTGADDYLLTVARLVERYGAFKDFLGGDEDQQATRMVARRKDRSPDRMRFMAGRAQAGYGTKAAAPQVRP